MQRLLAFILCVLCAGPGRAADQAAPDVWQDWQLVVGDWIGDEGHGQPGSPTRAGFSFSPELDGKILVRRDRSDYPAASGRPAFSHEGLMVIYRDEASKQFRAQSFDNEGHVIEYGVDVTPGRRIVFTSPTTTGAPTYRLVYEPSSSGLAIRFEIAPPDKPADFALYVAGAAHRR
jgi:hypothetical protein